MAQLFLATVTHGICSEHSGPIDEYSDEASAGDLGEQGYSKLTA